MSFFKTAEFNPQATHLTLSKTLSGPWPDGTQIISFGMGCFWGAEKKFWALPGVVCTSVGYQGGAAPTPTYREVCSGSTGHAEMVQIAYDPSVVSTYDLLKIFWENHDPTQGNRQGNDIGSQYRSAIFCSTGEQITLARDTARIYGDALAQAGLGAITTQIELATSPSVAHTYWLAEDYHQQYLIKNPNGYDCHAHTGIYLPAMV